MPDLLFKFLDETGAAYHGGSGVWPLPRDGKPGKWLTIKGEIIPCHNGLHLCEEKDILTWAAPALYVAEAGKKRVDHGDKIVVARARLLYRVETWNDKNLRLFAADCAERALRREEKAARTVDKRSWDAVRIARDYARGKATGAELSAAWSAAGSAARSAARSAAGYAAGYAEQAWQSKRLLRYLKVEA